MVLQTAIRERAYRVMTHQMLTRMNTPDTAERRGVLSAGSYFAGSERACHRQAAALDLVVKYQTLADRPETRLRGSAETGDSITVAWRSGVDDLA
ncbi:hypothetical protein C9426_23895 [Serratia sp. S1B]|nr:hypothetical protein C9426_23895 [Serratia sp. S1B]